jgi:hypothetical protein
MEGLLSLPLEISRQILIDAVKVRGIRRAARLRLVCRSWKKEVSDAICRSGILDEEEDLDSSPFWFDDLTFKTLRKGAQLSRPLQTIRRVAECLLIHNGRGKNEPEALNK